MMTGHNHEEKLQELIDATTDLTEEVAVGKKELDTAVSSAKEDAASALSSSQVSTSKATEASQSAALATAKAGEAKASADSAAKVVTGGTATLTPTAGKIPLADSKGAIDSGWIPLIQAMYPHYGVIGSVDKLTTFNFRISVSDANNIYWMNNSVHKFNIAGRLVRIKTPSGWSGCIACKLPEAESTPERAIAFDDIFLNWDGVVTPYRSITPHRTVTGYDADAIATEHGYSKVQEGLYKIGDTYALLLGRVARRNKGAYHPVFNPEGCNSVRVLPSGNSSTWFSSTSVTFGSREDAFDPTKTGKNSDNPTGNSTQNFGAISDGSNVFSTNKKYYDAIYVDDFTQLYYSARAVIDRKALLDDSFNRAVAGETFMGAEGTPNYEPYHTDTRAIYRAQTYGKASYSMGEGLAFKQQLNMQYPAVSTSWGDLGIPFCFIAYVTSEERGRELCYLGRQPSHTSYVNIRSIQPLSESEYLADRLTITKVEYCGAVQTFSMTNNGIVPTSNHLVKTYSARPQFLMVDIIGSLDAMPDEWKEHGIPGNWLAVGENGESLIPDGTSKNFKLSRKCLECYQVLETFDKGVTWRDITPARKSDFESASNSTNGAWLNGCMMVFYRTSANPFESASRRSVLSIGDGFASNSNNKDQHYAAFGSNLIGKVVNANDYGIEQFPLKKYAITRVNNIPYASAAFIPEHDPITRMSTGCNIAYKALPTLAHNGKNYLLSIYYKEMRKKDGRWGDNNKFEIIEKQSTVTDLNKEACIAGLKEVKLPYHFDGEY